MAIWLVLILAAYLLGSVPFSQIVARFSRGIDLRRYGTGQVGSGNLWRMTHWWLALPASIYDFSKGLGIVWVANVLEMSIAQQLVVGLAAIVGHNWSIFLRFSGGRGIITTIGVIFILTVINDITPWVAIVFFTILVIVTIIMRSSPVGVLLGVAAIPVVTWGFQEPLSITLGFSAMFAVIIIKRLTAPRATDLAPRSKRRLIFNRLFFDRDIADRRAWMYRKPPEASSVEQPEPKKG
jgi:glycerol-3-phosphate acyltransferase PlsY